MLIMSSLKVVRNLFRPNARELNFAIQDRKFDLVIKPWQKSPGFLFAPKKNKKTPALLAQVGAFSNGNLGFGFKRASTGSEAGKQVFWGQVRG